MQRGKRSLQQIFVTDRLILRPRTLADLDDCMAMDRDPEVTRYIPGPWADPEAHRRFVINGMESDFGEGLGYWSIFSKTAPKQFLGWIMLIPYDTIGPDIEIGWRLNRHAWGQGYATEAARPVLDHGFDTLNLPRIVANIFAGNDASIKVAEKLGMKFLSDEVSDGLPCKDYGITQDERARMLAV